MVNPIFAKWASGFSGCDGDPSGRTWLCGYEYGSGGDKEAELQEMFEEDVSKPRTREDWSQNEKEQFEKERYTRYTLKILCAMKDEQIENWQNLYNKENWFGTGSDYFKLNLYPIAFAKFEDKDGWKDGHTNSIGLADKDSYLDWCKNYRFPRLQSWVRTFSPNVIVCTGIRHCEQFLKAFGAAHETTDRSLAGRRISYGPANSGKTFVAVINYPRFPRNVDLAATGRRLAQLQQEFLSRC